MSERDRNPSTDRLETLAIHAGQAPDPTSGSVMPPLVLSSTFVQQSPGQHRGFDYSRAGNPTRQTLEECLAALEGGRHGVAFASGCAAMSALFHTLRPGDHMVVGDDVYGGTFRLLRHVMEPMGIEPTFVDLTDRAALGGAIRPETKLVWIETPTNPLLKIVDIEEVVGIAHGRGIPVGVDNTFATPCLQRPLDLGADVVVHSTTKYLNGHSDVVGGIAITSDDGLAERLRFHQKSVGAVPSPFDCYLVLRGVKTLPVRMERHCQSASVLARWLAERPEVERVIYPGLASHPQKELADRQMKGPGGMVTFIIKGGEATARRFLERTELFALAESLGGVESLIEHPGLMTHASVPADVRAGLGIEDGLIRLSVGLEAVEDLQGDLARALE
jgi:cystathionine beta-lyase/cystathionine gamma-synthase